MHNADVIRILAETADLLDIDGANPFRIRAFRNAIETLENFPSDLREARDLEDLPGIGKGLASHIRDILKKGDFDEHRALLEKYPPGLLALLRVQGLGPKKVRKLFDALDVDGLDKLEEACRTGKVKGLPGFGEKSEKKILQGIAHARAGSGRFLLDEATAIAEGLLNEFRAVKGVEQAETAGSLRRGKESIGDVDVLVTGAPAALKAAGRVLLENPDTEEILAEGENKISVRLRQGIQVDLRLLKPAEFGSAMQYFTGSKEHNVALRRRAQERGMTLNEYGLFREKDKKRLAGETEAGIYRALGLQWIPPEMRENRGEIEAAEAGEIPALVELRDIRGDLHSHTVETDGAATIDEMAAAAQARGLEYLAITDHSKAVTVARGMDEKRLRRHVQAIHAARERFPKLRLLAGVEVDILKDGSLDLADEALALCDFVAASVHSAFGMDEAEMTRRVVSAMRSPHVDALGHPTGRLIKGRPGYALNLPEILAAAKETGTLLELNAHPMRLDLNDVWCREAAGAGLRVVISTDSHNVQGLANMRYGIATARRGWLRARQVANAMPWKEFSTFMQNRKGKSTPVWKM